ncbi:MAG: ChbG/HpnK family deacetylase [bacterium]
MNKKLVITADDFGISEDANEAILRAFKEGSLTNTCIIANGDAFEHAMKEIFPQISEIGFGVHLNIIEGKTLHPINRDSLLYDSEWFYSNSFGELLTKSFNQTFLKEVETDFRFQIEKVLEKAKVDHLNSHVHVHAIPNIFRITCKLAKEYGIKYVRTQNEIPYFIPDIKKHFDSRFPVNLIKLGILNIFSYLNRRTLKEFGILSNDFFGGVTYTSYMDENAIKYCLEKIEKTKSLTEVILHPTVDRSRRDNYKEFLTLINPELKKTIQHLNFELTNFK